MVRPAESQYEVNEVAWWSNWAKVNWVTKNSYVFLSRKFDEYFYNRGGFLIPEIEALTRMKIVFQKEGRDEYYFVQRMDAFEGLRDTLRLDGYGVVDQMSVMECVSPSFRVNSEAEVEEIGEGGVEEWSETYLLAFYGETSLMEHVVAVVRKTLRDKKASFLLARHHESPAGTVAAYRTDGMLGLYCVGTRPKFRNKRVANTMLEFSHRMSNKEGRKLILQTLLSDSTEQFYVNLGFERLYLKDLFAKNLV